MSRAPIRVIDLAELQRVIDHDVAHRAVRQGFVDLGTGRIEAPQELAFTLSNHGEMHIKGAWATGSRWVVFKLATGSFPVGANGGCSLLVDADTGQPCVLLDDGGWLTEMRTAAAGALVTNLLAVDGPLSVAVLGTGVQARFQLAALRARRTLREVRVWGRNGDRTREYAAECCAIACATVDEAVRDVDVIVTATGARSPILFGHHLSPGTHVTAMGADMIGKRELADDVFDRARSIAVEDVTAASRVGELQHQSADIVDRAINIADLIARAERGSINRDPADITIADLCGVGASDASIASFAVDALGL